MAVTVTELGFFGTTTPSPAALSGPVPVANTAGDWMVALVTWRQAVAGAGITFTVADDAHNWWEPLGAPAGTSGAAGVTRSAIWVAPAARAATIVNVAPTGYTQAYCVMVLGVAGMAPWMTLTAITPGFANAATALSLALAAPAAQALFLSVLATDLNTSTIGGPGAGWTTLTPVIISNGTGHTADLTLSAAYQVTSGAATAAWTASAALDMSGIAAGLLVSATAPAQPNPNWPVVITETAPGGGVQTPPDQLTWIPLSARTLDFSITQGRPYLLGALQAGQGILRADNPDGALIPPGTGSFTGIDSGTPVRIRTAWPSSATPWAVPFNGFFQQWPQAWDADSLRGYTEATVTDAYAYTTGRLQPPLRTEIGGEPGLYAYWPCDDPAGSVVASNLAPGNPLPLTVTQSKFGTGGATFAFGANTGALAGDKPGGMFSQAGVPAGNTVGYSLHCADGNYPPITGGVTVEVWSLITATTPNLAFLLSLMSDVANVLNIYASNTAPFLVVQTRGVNGTTTATNVTSAINPFTLTTPFHVAVAFDRTSYLIVFNGGQITATGTWANQLPARFAHVWVNGNFATFGSVGGGTFNGDSGHTALYTGKLPAARIAGHYQAGVTAFAGEAVYQRAERILSAGGLPGRRFILAENSPLDVDVMASAASIAGQTAATALANVAASTPPAVMAVAPCGDLFYLPKWYVSNQPVKWVLGERTDLGEIPYLGDIAFGYDPARVVNDIQVTQPDTGTITVPSVPEAASQAQYGTQTYSPASQLQGDATSAYGAGPGNLDLANWVATTLAAPHQRVGTVTVNAASHPTAWPFWAAVSPGDMVTVNRRPPTSPGLLLTVTARVTQTTRNLRFDLGQGVTGSITCVLDYAPEENTLTADDPVRGLLNGVNCLGW